MRKVREKLEQTTWRAYNRVIDLIYQQNGDSEFNDGGSTNWARNVAIGVVIAGVLLLLFKPFLQEIFDAVKAKIMSWLS